LREEKDFALPRLFLCGDLVSAAQEGAGGMRGGFFSDFGEGAYQKENLAVLSEISEKKLRG